VIANISEVFFYPKYVEHVPYAHAHHRQISRVAKHNELLTVTETFRYLWLDLIRWHIFRPQPMLGS
jgi:hypothetical protein